MGCTTKKKQELADQEREEVIDSYMKNLTKRSAYDFAKLQWKLSMYETLLEDKLGEE